MADRNARAVPVIALTGYLGAGKTTLLNHVLRAPGARIGLIINDFGELNVDAGLVAGQIEEPMSITGGCICHLPEDGGLDAALETLADPRLALDAIIVEVSGVADPAAVSRIIRFSGVDQIRHGGVVDVVDAVEQFNTIDTQAAPPQRYAAASLVVVNKLDRIMQPARAETFRRIKTRISQSNPATHVVGAQRGRVDPQLLYDVADHVGVTDRTPLPRPDKQNHHIHAEAVTVMAEDPVDPGALVDLLEHPPQGVYRIKGTVAVGTRHYIINVVGRSAHVMTALTTEAACHLVVIGTGFDIEQVRIRTEEALRPCTRRITAAGMRRLQRLRQLSK